MASKRSFQLPRPLFNPYFWITLAALLWLGLLDAYNWLEQYRLAKRIEQMRKQLAFYEQQIQELAAEEAALQSDPYIQTYYARRQYWVKKPAEKLYILRAP